MAQYSLFLAYQTNNTFPKVPFPKTLSTVKSWRLIFFMMIDSPQMSRLVLEKRCSRISSSPSSVCLMQQQNIYLKFMEELEIVLGKFPKFHIRDDDFAGKLGAWKGSVSGYLSTGFEEEWLRIYLLMVRGEQLVNMQQNCVKVSQLLYETIYNSTYFALVGRTPGLHQAIARSLVYPVEDACSIESLADLNQIFTSFCIFQCGIEGLGSEEWLETREGPLREIYLYINTGVLKVLGWGDPVLLDMQVSEFMDHKSRNLLHGLVDPNQILTLAASFLKDSDNFDHKLTQSDSLYLKQLSHRKRQQFTRTLDYVAKRAHQVTDHHKLLVLMVEKANLQSDSSLDPVYQHNKLSDLHIAQVLFAGLTKATKLWRNHFQRLTDDDKDKHLAQEMHNKKYTHLLICARSLRSLGHWERSYLVFYQLIQMSKNHENQKYLTYIYYQLGKLLFHLQCTSDGIAYLQQSFKIIHNLNECYHPRYNKLSFTLRVGFMLLSILAFSEDKAPFQQILLQMTKVLTLTQQNSNPVTKEETSQILKANKYQIKFQQFCEQSSSFLNFNFQQLSQLRSSIQELHGRKALVPSVNKKLYSIAQAPQIDKLLSNSIIKRITQRFKSNRSSSDIFTQKFPKFDIAHFSQFNVQMLMLLVFSDVTIYKNAQNPYLQVIENLELVSPSFFQYIPLLFQYSPKLTFQENLIRSYIQYYFSQYDDALIALVNLQLIHHPHNQFRDKLLGQINEIQGQYQQAIDIYLRVNDDDPSILFNLANCYKILNQDQKAIEFYQRAADRSRFYRTASNYLISKINNKCTYMVNSIILKKNLSVSTFQSEEIMMTIESKEREDVKFFSEILRKEIIPKCPDMEDTLKQFLEAIKCYSKESMYLNQAMVILEPISRGGQAEVLKIRFEEKEYACKIYEFHFGINNYDTLKEALEEAIILGNLNEVNDGSLIRLEHIAFEFVMVNQTRIIKVKFILPFYQNGTLFNILHQQKTKEFWIDFIWKLLSGIKILKDNQIAHLDLKPANILVDNEWRPILADFGLSIEQFHSFIYSNFVKNSKKYTAPEILERSHFTKKSDIYSFGCIVYEIFTKKEPYFWLMEYQYHGGLCFGEKHDLSEIGDSLIVGLVLGCTESKVEMRFSMEEAYEYLRSNFFN